MAEAKKPADHQKKQPTKAQVDKQQREVLEKFMSTGIDFSPFTIDPGDGTEWSFKPDPMPSDTERLRKAMNSLQRAVTSGEGAQEAFDELAEGIRSMLIDDKQKKEFPKPNYGQNALMFFAIHLATGRDGLPTEGA